MNNLLPSSQAANHAGSPEKPSLVTRGAGPWLHISAQSLWACSELSPFTVFLGRSSKKAQQLSLTAFISRWQTSLENREGVFRATPRTKREQWMVSSRAKPLWEAETLWGNAHSESLLLWTNSRQIQGQILISAGKLLCCKSAQGCSASGPEKLPHSKLLLQNDFQTLQ